jgi:hypothetical protein
MLPTAAALFSITPLVILLGFKTCGSAIGLGLVVRTVMMVAMTMRMLSRAFTEVCCPDEKAERDHGNGPEQHQQLF